MSALQSSQQIDDKLVIVKIGTESILKTLTAPQNGQKYNRLALDRVVLRNVVDQMATLKARGYKTLLVSSGAIGRARILLDCIKTGDELLSQKQKLASVGQAALMVDYNKRLMRHGLFGSQILITKYSFKANGRLKAVTANAIEAILNDTRLFGIVNENDLVATDEIRFGDNDKIAELLTLHFRPAHLIFLTNSGGVYTCDPRKPEARLLNIMTPADIPAINIGSSTGNGSGGMGSKLSAAEAVLAATPEAKVHILSPKGSMIGAVEGKEEGTLILSNEKRRDLPHTAAFCVSGVVARGREALLSPPLV